jgi:hypothetical protein
LDLFLIFQFLHVITMFAAVAAAMLPEIVLHAIARRGDVAGLRAFAPISGTAGKLIPVLFVVGLIFGLIAAIVGQIDLLRPWLVASYVIFAIAMVTGAVMSGPWAVRLAEAAFASPTDAPSAELVAATHDRRGLISTAILMSSLVSIIFLMVVKPGA